ncbi:hypothetical protein B0H14DRAFT_2375237 [Mycena olivaceomarginata]|nr:hypothetical protein B0H14DRAFT_2375237 [Mycena olivaceomarginata]
MVFLNGRSSFQIHDPSSGIKILHRAVPLEALYDSAESFPQPNCHPETRTELLENLYSWATDQDSKHSIRWLHGPAGAGKSAIMQTLCQRLQDGGRLGGSFFFKRGHTTRGNARMLFATLAYQLALHQPKFRDLISRSVEKNPSVLGRSIDVQLRTLILEPCKMVRGASPSVLLIDGLDECEGNDIQRQILRSIGSTANPACPPLRILVASRPEPHIRETFDAESLRGHSDSTDIQQSFKDVRTYLRHEFSRIHHEHRTTMGDIPTPWPSREILKLLVDNSSGYFIYASTVIKFIDDEYFRPSRQLDLIVQNSVLYDTESPFVTLDLLYMQILSRVPSRSHSRLSDILSVIIHCQENIELESLEQLLGLERGDVALVLRPLHSVVKVPLSNFDSIQLHHASFRDFLNNQARSASFWVGSSQHRAKLGLHSQGTWIHA